VQILSNFPNSGGIALKPAFRTALIALAGFFMGVILICSLLITGVLSPEIFSTRTAANRPPAANPLESALLVAFHVKMDDFPQLSTWIHPEKGVIFTPFSTVDPERDLSFSAQEVANFAADRTVYLWGLTAVEGAPIQMSALDYMHRYVGERDYAMAPLAAVGSILRTGDSPENVAEVFPNSIFVELHIPHAGPKRADDWSSLKIVFEEYEDELKVIAFIHSEMTL